MLVINPSCVYGKNISKNYFQGKININKQAYLLQDCNGKCYTKTKYDVRD